MCKYLHLNIHTISFLSYRKYNFSEFFDIYWFTFERGLYSIFPGAPDTISYCVVQQRISANAKNIFTLERPLGCVLNIPWHYRCVVDALTLIPR